MLNLPINLLTVSAVIPFLMYWENCFLKASSSSSFNDLMYSATFWPKMWLRWTSAEKSFDSSSYPGKRRVLEYKNQKIGYLLENMYKFKWTPHSLLNQKDFTYILHISCKSQDNEKKLKPNIFFEINIWCIMVTLKQSTLNIR